MRALGIDVGGTFTDAVLVSEGEVRTAKVRTREHQEQSVLAAARGGRGGERGSLHARDDDRHERAPRAAWRADGVRRHGGLRARPSSATSDPRSSLPAVRRASGAARSARTLGRRARSHRAGRRAGAARSGNASRARRGGDRRLPPLRFQGQPPRGGGDDRAAASLSAMPTSSPPTRSRPSSASTSGRRPRRWTRISVPSWPDICTPFRMPARKRASCRRSSCAPPAVLRRSRKPRSTRPSRCSRDQPRASSGLRESLRSPDSRTPSRSTWAGRPPTSARSRTASRGASTSETWADSPSGSRRSRCTRWEREAARSCGWTRAARCESARRARDRHPAPPATGSAESIRP